MRVYHSALPREMEESTKEWLHQQLDRLIEAWERSADPSVHRHGGWQKNESGFEISFTIEEPRL